MTVPNRNVAWARAIVDELVAAGVSAVCVTPGSRSTPLTVACYEHDDVDVFSHLDERSGAFFALGRGRRTGTVTPLICTSGTAAANYHPAVIEAHQSRVPLVLLTADRPPELRDSGANQTIDQEKLYGDAVRWYRDLPEPDTDDRTLRSVRVTAARAVAEATGTPAGPVHLNVPFRKPLAPVEVPDDVPDASDWDSEVGLTGRDGPFVETTPGTVELDDRRLQAVADALSATRGLIVAGPADAPGPDPEAIAALAHATGFPILADPLSGLRFGGHVRTTTTIGGYDGFLAPAVTDDWPNPEVVFRFGASPTSKALRKYLARTAPRQLVVDPAGGWREAEFTATDLVVADPSRLAGRLARVIGGSRGGTDDGTRAWRDRWLDAETTHWDVVEGAIEDDEDGPVEGGLLADVVDLTPEPATIVVSNSTPVRDLDRFGRPRAAGYTVLGNRGASGIDGIVSTALGAGSATTDHLTLVIGDLAYYHDMNGLLALERCDVEATIVVINNDGGGIFHMLPIEAFDPPFTEGFKTPHGLDFEPTGDLYGFDFERVADRAGFQTAYAEAVERPGSHVLDVQTNAETSHRAREKLEARVVDLVGE